jgi:hypothetical protein
MTDCNPNEILTNKPENLNYLSSNFFKFNLDRIPIFSYFVQSANIPMLTSRSIIQPANFGTFPKIPATNFIFDDLQINFLVDNEMKSWKEIYDWMKSLGNLSEYGNQSPHIDKFSNATLLILNSAYKPLMRVTYYYVFPITLGSINFTSTSTNNDPVVSSVNFAYSYYDLEYI